MAQLDKLIDKLQLNQEILLESDKKPMLKSDAGSKPMLNQQLSTAQLIPLVLEIAPAANRAAITQKKPSRFEYTFGGKTVVVLYSRDGDQVTAKIAIPGYDEEAVAESAPAGAPAGSSPRPWELARTRQIGEVRLASVGSGSLPALRAFLRAEQFYRRSDWDSAIAYYQRAIGADSTFALPWWRIGSALGWQRTGLDSVSRQYHLTAGALNRGLAPRDSLLVTADSLAATLYGTDRARLWAGGGRLFATLREAARRYPQDPEVWYAVGEGGYHFSHLSRTAITDRDVLNAFDRAIALDSAFGPAYIHPVQLGLALDGAAAAIRYADAYLALDPKDVNAGGIRLVRTQLSGGPTAALDSASSGELLHAFSSLIGAPDTTETLLHVAAALRARASGPDTAVGRLRLASALAMRGHLREALALADGHQWRAELMAFGAVPADSTQRQFARWLASDTLWDAMPLWWVQHGDTLSLQRLLERLEALAQGAPSRRLDLGIRSRAEVRAEIEPLIGNTRIALAYARGDTVLSRKPISDGFVDFLSNLRRRRTPGTDCPNRFVGENDMRQRLACQAG